MALNNYAALQTAIGDFLNRSDLTASIPDFITLVEARLRRLVRTKNVTVNATISLNAASVALPTDIKELRFVEITGKGQLEIRPYSDLADLKVVNTVAKQPKFGAMVNATLYLVPTPDVAYPATIIYEPEIVPLVTTNTNWLLANHPDIYLYGALVEAAPYLRDDPRVPAFDARFTSALAELELARDRMEYPNTPRMRPSRVYG